MQTQITLAPTSILKSVIAVVGCDGAGKSTLSADLMKRMADGRPVHVIYLGQSSGYLGARIRGLPIIGPAVAKFLETKAETTRSGSAKTPGAGAIVAMYLLSRWRAHKFNRMLRCCRRGEAVITDRYPQAEMSGFYYDGPGLGAVSAKGWLYTRLKGSEHALYARMASHVPALVIRLNIDADTAYARKPDHRLSTLQAKAAGLPRLTFNGANILDLDARAPYPQVLGAALAASATAVSSRELKPRQAPRGALRKSCSKARQDVGQGA